MGPVGSLGDDPLKLAALFPEALARGTGMLTFTATCYGRLLRPAPGEPADLALPSAVDCYRYALSQPGVGACLSAPRNHRELRQNLEVLERLDGKPISPESVLQVIEAGIREQETNVAPFKRIVEVQLTDEPLPRTPIRKVMRGHIRDNYEFDPSTWERSWKVFLEGTATPADDEGESDGEVEAAVGA